MADNLRRIEQPELVFGLAGPIGVDLDAVEDELTRELSALGYRSHPIKVTREMKSLLPEDPEPAGSDFLSRTRAKIKGADNLCAEFRDKATLARIGMKAIRAFREGESRGARKSLDATAFIIRQLKRPEEVELLRRVYGRLFFLVSAYGSRTERLENLVRNIERDLSGSLADTDIHKEATSLRDDDERESTNPFGQNLGETFPLGDVFVDGIHKPKMHDQIHRFLFALFGRNEVGPTRDEYGMYEARAASLRSSDLSRQVGSAIFSNEGELLSIGCNEVPKAFGGTYWDGESPDYRDIKLGDDPNEQSKNRILRDLFRQLGKLDLLSDKAISIGDPNQLVVHLTEKAAVKEDSDTRGGLIGAEILDVTEYGRVVHAEMCAICDAARFGRSIKNATLFCTTFPCHNCAKHILAAGIRRVVYIEPYPKSRVKDLHKNEIEIEGEATEKVSFQPFIGISPNRYRDIFTKGRRKGQAGQARDWYFEKPLPMVSILSPFYLDTEGLAVAQLVTAELPLLRHINRT